MSQQVVLLYTIGESQDWRGVLFDSAEEAEQWKAQHREDLRLAEHPYVPRLGRSYSGDLAGEGMVTVEYEGDLLDDARKARAEQWGDVDA